MQPLPHSYPVTSVALPESNVSLYSEAIEALEVAPPSEYGGPGNLWSPETALVGAVASCYTLSFKAIARGSNLPWDKLDCEVTGTLDKSDGTTQFTKMSIVAHLTLPAHADVDKAQRLLERAETLCLITNSLTAEITLEVDVQINESVVA